MSSEKFRMDQLLAILDTTLQSGMSYNANQITITTDLEMTPPLILPHIYLMPMGSPKEYPPLGNDQFQFWHKVRIVPWISLRTTKEASLTDGDGGLIVMSHAIEDVLENNMLKDGDGIPRLNDVIVSIENYEYAGADNTDNIYCRASEIIYDALPKIYVQSLS